MTQSRPKSRVAPEWSIADHLVAYEDAIAYMEQHVTAMQEGMAGEMVWLLEHPPLYTAGTSARPEDLLDNERFPMYQTGRGGQFTYHGPGQRVAYVMLDLKKRAAPDAPDVRAYVKQLEAWLIASLAELGVESFIREGRVGVWTYDLKGKEAKIAAIGIRIRKWITFHGICLNVSPDLSHYKGIVPCGIAEYGVTSLADLGININMNEFDQLLKKNFFKEFC
jgi:lipoyl(octanoyl) transferase